MNTNTICHLWVIKPQIVLFFINSAAGETDNFETQSKGIYMRA